MKSACILMTGTIAPNTILVQRNNIQDRLDDYKKSIDFYLSETGLPVIFVENSNYDLDSDEDFQRFKEHSNFTLIRKVPAQDTSRGKGFQEFYLLDEVIQNEIPFEYLFKVTGRYIIRNIKEIIPKVQGEICIDLHKKMKVAITGFFGVKRDFYLENIRGLYTKVNDSEGVFIEHVIYEKLNSDSTASSQLLPLNPIYQGVSGSHGNSMKRNPYKMMIRRLERSINRRLGVRQFLVEY